MTTAVPTREPIRHVQTDKPYVALTFDDGPDDSNVPKLLELFAREQVKATFFVIGNHVAKYPEISRQMVNAGHELGNHSTTHAYPNQCETFKQVQDEITDCQRIVEHTVGIKPVIYRAPGINHDDRIWQVIDTLGLPSFGASKGSHDWDRSLDATAIFNFATDGVTAGDILLFHSWNDLSVQIMPDVIDTIRKRGLEMVTVSELQATAIG